MSELCALFDVTQPAISQQLRVLREAGLVRVRKDGRLAWYSLDPGPLREVFDWAAHYEKFWRTRLDLLGRVLEREAKRGPRKQS